MLLENLRWILGNSFSRRFGARRGSAGPGWAWHGMAGQGVARQGKHRWSNVMKIALLHRHHKDRIKETNAAFPFLEAKGIDVLTFKKFDRTGNKFWKSILWIFYAPLLVFGKGYDVIYCDDSMPFYPILVKFASPNSKLVLRIGDFHLMYYTSGWLYEFLHFFEKIGWRIADWILPISKEMYWEIIKGIEINESYGRYDRINNDPVVPKVHTILDPVNENDFLEENAGNKNIVMFHGVLTKNKGIDVLIESARKLKNISFVIYGDGPDRKRLENISPSNIFFQGWISFDRMPQAIATCTIGVALRSDNAGNEYVVTSPFLQYGICGKPCLVTRREVFGDYPWQFSGVDEMVEKIKYLIAYPEEGKKLKNYIIKNHDAKKIADEIWQILKSL